jgi:hypothetical protein
MNRTRSESIPDVDAAPPHESGNGSNGGARPS